MLDDVWQELLGKKSFQVVNSTVDQLLDLIRPEAVALVDSFEIPDNVLASSIGSYDGNVYEKLLECARKSSLNG